MAWLIVETALACEGPTTKRRPLFFHKIYIKKEVFIKSYTMIATQKRFWDQLTKRAFQILELYATIHIITRNTNQ
jgi:hypothetical protein